MEQLPELEFVSWKQFHELCFELARKIKADGNSFDTLISISRGGHVISRILSDFLMLPIFNVSIQSYEALQQKELKINQKLGMFLDKQNILLVDEIVDSGRSLQRAYNYLRKIRVNEITTVSLHTKPHAVIQPDYYSAETTKWVVYPYEVRETINSLKPIWENAQLPLTDLRQKLIKGGFPEIFVDAYLQ